MPTSYSDVLGSGDRRFRLLGLSVSGAFLNLERDLIDGDTAAGSLSFVHGQNTSSYEIRFDFRGIVLIDEAKFYQSTSVTHGTWEWQGSNDGTTWTPIGSFVLGGATNPQIHDVWHGNLTPYQHVRLKGLSGTVSTSILFEIEFRCDHTVGDPATNARTTQDVAEVAIEPELPAVRNTTDAAEIALERDPEYVLVRDTTDAVEAAIETYPVVRVTQEVIEVVVTPPRGVTIVPPLPLPLQQQVYDERFLLTEPWRGFFSGLLTERPALGGFMELAGGRLRRRVTVRAEDGGIPPHPLPLQQEVIDERRLVAVPWAEFFRSLVPKFQITSLPLPVHQQITDDRLLMTTPWVIWFLWLLSRRTGRGDIEEFMPDIVFMDSFDHYGTNDLHLKYALANETTFGGAHIAFGQGRNGTNALGISGQQDNADYLRFSGLAGPEYYLEFGFNPGPNAGSPPPGNQIAAFRDSGITQVELRLMATGQLAVTSNGTMLGQTTEFAFGTNTWRHIGFRADTAFGNVVVTVDSIPKITLTGVDIVNSGSTRITEFVLFSQSNNNAVASYYDDIILSKDGFCSDSRVAAVFPKGNGFWQQWIQCPNAYTYPLGSGNRVANIAITQNATAPLLGGTLSQLVDGNYTTNAFCNGIAVDSTKWIRFDFGAVLSRHITEVRLLWDNNRAQGTWLWQGSGDGSGWTDLMTAPFTLQSPSGNASSGSGTWQVVKLTNGLFFRYYRLRGVDGSPASEGLNSIQDIEFYIDPGTAPPPLYQNVDERDSNGDDDYNWSKTAGHRVSYDFQSLNMTGTIKGVQHVATMRKDDDRVRLVNLFTRIGSTDYDGPDISVNDTYVAQRQVWVKNPATDAQWEVSEVDSSEWGEKLVS